MRTPLISPNSISKPNIRKHSCLERLFADEDHLHHSQLQQVPFTFSSSPLSPGKKLYPGFCTCICFVLVFFILTIVAFALCSNLDTPVYEGKASFSADKKQSEFPVMDKPMSSMPALRGLGSVYRKSSKLMSELVVAHVSESTAVHDLRLFLRTLHRSGVTARADVVFLFAATKFPSAMVDVIHEENQYFQRLLKLLSSNDVDKHREVSNNVSMPSPLSSSTPSFSSNATISPFSIDAFRRSGLETGTSLAQALWGTRNPNSSPTNMTDNRMLLLTEWGSVVGFDASELNPEDGLQGFIDNPPLALRRWSCYLMLLGMVRHKFKRILLTDVSGVAFLRDPFLIFRWKVGLYLSMEDRPWGTTFGDERGIHSDPMDMEISDEDMAASGHPGNVSEFSWSRRQLSGYGAISIAGKAQHRKGSSQRQSGAATEVHRRGSTTARRRRGRKGAPAGGLCERVYGRRLWSSLEDSERRKKLVNSGAIMGSIQQVRGLANAMSTEIVKVALERRSRDPFPDSVLLSYLLHKSSSVLGKRVIEHLHLMDNEDSFVHSLTGSQQPSIFIKKTRAMASTYPMIHGNNKSRRWRNTMHAIHQDICSSHVDAMVYPDCYVPRLLEASRTI